MDEATVWRQIDALGHRCPVPTLRLCRVLRDAPPGAHLILLADDPMARIDIAHFAAQAGCTEFRVSEAEGGVFRFSLRAPALAADAARDARPE